jgi:hypothetical protein
LEFCILTNTPSHITPHTQPAAGPIRPRSIIVIDDRAARALPGVTGVRRRRPRKRHPSGLVVANDGSSPPDRCRTRRRRPRPCSGRLLVHNRADDTAGRCVPGVGQQPIDTIAPAPKRRPSVMVRSFATLLCCTRHRSSDSMLSRRCAHLPE